MAKHSECCKDCKNTVLLILSKIDGNAEPQYDLGLSASLEGYKGTPCFASLELIYNNLQGHRGFRSFVKATKLPKVDYYLPSFRTVVEFDESQHFTEPRFISLSYYPSDLPLGYDRQRWMELTRRLNKKDNDPPYRDEQRAWYDTLRDFSPVLLDNQPTVRLFARDRRWRALDVDNPQDVALIRKFVIET